MDKCYRFKPHELDGKRGKVLAEYLKGKVASCGKCCSLKVRVSRWVSPEYPDSELQQVACGEGCGCTHSVTGYVLEDVLNNWNRECDLEGFGPDYAEEVKVW